MRRTVLIAAQDEPHRRRMRICSTALDGLLSAREHLTRSLLGTAEQAHPAPLCPLIRTVNPVSRRNRTGPGRTHR